MFLVSLVVMFLCAVPVAHGEEVAPTLRELHATVTKNDWAYSRIVQAKIQESQLYTSECWRRLAKLSLEAFITIEPSGAVSSVELYPHRAESEGIVQRLMELTFPSPAERHVEWLLVWDGAGG